MDTPVIKRIALYARVSTLNGQNPEMQLAELREYAQARGWAVYRRVRRPGESGSKDSPAGTEPDDGRCPREKVRRNRGLEIGSPGPIAQAPGHND